ncbi:MAG: YfhO family protein [Pseudobutyrivibrio sp.]|nr:YfhO family protein [Pseudobutyrivibrio sp.]
MKLKMKGFLQKDFVKSFIICFLIACICFLPFIIKGKGFFVLTNDFNDQQIPFTIGLHNALLDGGISGFSWDVDLGTSTIDAYSFYEFGSPFFWLSMLFPANAFPYIVAWLFMLKFAFAGVTSCLYLRRFVKDSRWAVLGSVLYAFSGFSLINMLFYHFHDAIVCFPLLLIGLERLKEKKDYKLFVFTIFLNCFVNYFFFIGEVVFLIIYYLFRFASKDIKALFKDVVTCILCGILGVGMASFVFMPSIIFVMGNPRAGAFKGIIGMLTTTLTDYMYIAKSLILPTETMTSASIIGPQNFSSHGMYLPIFGLVLVIAYIIKKRDWLSRIILLCAVASFIPLLSDLFYMYSAAQMRWWYMFNLMVVLASIKVLEDPDRKAIKIGAAVYASLIAIFTIAINVLNILNVQDNQWIIDSKRFYLGVIVAFIGIIVTLLITLRPVINYRAALAMVCACSLALLLNTMYVYKTCDWMGYQAYKQRFDIAKQIELPSEQFRLNDTMNLISMTAHVAGFTNQTSTNTNSIFEFEDLFDYYHNVAGMPKNNIPGLAELLGGKYYISFQESNGILIDEYDTDLGKAYLYEKSACPIGFAMDSYITTAELKSLDVNQRAIALLDSVVLDEADVTDEIKADLEHTSASDIDFEKSIDDYVVEHTYGSVLGFTKDGHGVNCATGYDKDTYVYFSIPYDTGWTALIDGQKTDIIESGGMMILKVPAGEHSIALNYITPGFRVGLAVTIISLVIFIGLIIISKRREGN